MPAYISDDKTIKVWDAATGELKKTLVGHSDWVNAVAFSPDDKRIALGSDDETIKVWDTATGELKKTLAGHRHWVRAVAFSPDGKRIASASEDETIKVWDVASISKASRLLKKFMDNRSKLQAWHEITVSKTINHLKFSADGQHLLTNIGPIPVTSILTPIQKNDSESLQHLYISDQWLCYDIIPILRLQPDSEPTCYNTNNNRVAVEFRNGRILSFDIDRARLHSTLRFSFGKLNSSSMG